MRKKTGMLGLACFLMLLFTGRGSAFWEQLYLPKEGQWAAATGWNQRFPGIPKWVKPTKWQETFNRKFIKLAAGESFTLADIPGPGIINRIFFAIAPAPKATYRALVLKIYWDDEENPSVLAPVGDFFGAPFGKWKEQDSLAMSMQGGGMVSRFPMPFRKRARVVIENGFPDREAGVFYGINWYRVSSLPEEAFYFHALWRRENPTTEGKPFLVADLSGRGNFAGVRLYLQNLSTFWNKGINLLMQPEGFGMGNLEGWEEIYINDELVQHGTGTEEYFNAGAYFSHAPYSGMFEGVVMRSYLTGRTATYRFHLLDPIPFNGRFRMVWHHGPLDSIRADYAAAAYWYQQEPHKPQEIPGFKQRLPASPARHVAQAVAIWPLVYGCWLVNELAFE